MATLLNNEAKNDLIILLEKTFGEKDELVKLISTRCDSIEQFRQKSLIWARQFLVKQSDVQLIEVFLKDRIAFYEKNKKCIIENKNHDEHFNTIKFNETQKTTTNRYIILDETNIVLL